MIIRAHDGVIDMVQRNSDYLSYGIGLLMAIALVVFLYQVVRPAAHTRLLKNKRYADLIETLGEKTDYWKMVANKKKAAALRRLKASRFAPQFIRSRISDEYDAPFSVEIPESSLTQQVRAFGGASSSERAKRGDAARAATRQAVIQAAGDAAAAAEGKRLRAEIDERNRARQAAGAAATVARAVGLQGVVGVPDSERIMAAKSKARAAAEALAAAELGN